MTPLRSAPRPSVFTDQAIRSIMLDAHRFWMEEDDTSDEERAWRGKKKETSLTLSKLNQPV
jgi:hypothetical protein